MTTSSEVDTRRLAHVIDSLCAEFAGVFARETVAFTVRDSLRQLGGARVSTFLPVLAHRFARERLRASARVQGHADTDQPRVLFVCTHNAARSQLAMALLASKAQGQVIVGSAGTNPAAEIQPEVLQALAEIGVEAEESYPKPLTVEVVQAADVVVTMGCGDACPLYPGKRYLDWELPDPAGLSLDAVREVRDEIACRVDDLLDQLRAGSPDEELDDALLRVLGEPTRAAIVRLLASEQLCPCDLVEETGAAQPKISNHLRVLRDAELVDADPVSRNTYYRLRAEPLDRLAQQLAALAEAARRASELPRRPC